MSKHDGIIRFKIEFEDIPILNMKTKKFKDIEETMKEIKNKIE
jgi:hypothetical protein